MTTLRTKLAAIALIVGTLSVMGGSVFAQDRHPVCAAKQHDCGSTATISNCCCGDQGAAHNEATPVQSRAEGKAGQPAIVALPHVVHVVSAPQPLSAVHTVPPRLCLLDLPTLFASLLI